VSFLSRLFDWLRISPGSGTFFETTISPEAAMVERCDEYARTHLEPTKEWGPHEQR
jgi:hypothetical protein